MSDYEVDEAFFWGYGKWGSNSFSVAGVQGVHTFYVKFVS